MKILVDMNVSPLVAEGLQALGHEATHWSHVGKLTASDTEIMAWARRERLVVLTCDLDFGHLLSASGALLPSVVQVRSQRMTAPLLSALVASAPEAHREELSGGALLTLDNLRQRRRLRLLPIGRQATPDLPEPPSTGTE